MMFVVRRNCTKLYGIALFASTIDLRTGMGDDKVVVSFNCQRCLQPIKLDDTLNSFNEHILAELTLPILSTPDVDLESQATSFDNCIHPCRLTDSGNGANGFMVISDGKEVEGLGHKMKVQATLYDILSDNSAVDHPLCDECTDALLEQVENDIKYVNDDYEDYRAYHKKLEKETDYPLLAPLQKEFEDLTNEEKRLLMELEALEQEEKETLEAIQEQEAESEKLNEEENRYWKEFVKHRQDYLHTDNELRSLKKQLQYTESQLDKLKKTNVFNATFHIWHSGHFGTINNFRLGRLPSVPVEWSEINAAWGQTTLLLTALARKMDFQFEGYKLVPFGNHSYIEDLKDSKELPLFGTGGFRFLWDIKVDTAMVAFLDCLLQFKRRISEIDNQFQIPYRIHKGKIENAGSCYPIRIQFNSEEQWTKALKFMLTNLKWYLAWVASYRESELY